MENKSEKAAELHKCGRTCSQAVTCAFCKEAGLDEELAAEISAKYSRGAYETCGAVMGAYIIANFMNGEKNMNDPAEWHEKSQKWLEEIASRFEQKNGSLLCSEIRGNALRSCRGCVQDAAEILQQIIEEKSANNK